jgi:hypothetical protein
MKILHQMRALQRNFLWGGPYKDSKWPLVAWRTLCRPKYHGGMGIRDPQLTSSTLATKLWWRWIKSPSSLWAKLWKFKYTPLISSPNINSSRWNPLGSMIYNNAWQNQTGWLSLNVSRKSIMEFQPFFGTMHGNNSPFYGLKK